MSALSSLLVQDQVVAVRTIEEALQRQVIFGGQLDTNLLELRAIDEDLLVDYMARVSGLPPISREELEAAETQAVRLLPRELAERRGLVPLALRGRRLRVALASPPKGDELRDVADALGVDLEPGITTELRLRFALSRHYGSELPRRFGRLAGLIAASPAARVEPRRRPSVPPPRRPATRSGTAAVAPAPIAAEPSPAAPERAVHPPELVPAPAEPTPPAPDPAVHAPESVPAAAVESAPSAPEPHPDEPARPRVASNITPVAAPLGFGGAASEASPAPAPSEEERSSEAGLRGNDPTVLSPEDGLAILDGATSREAIFQTAVRVSGGFMEYSALFVVRDREARGKASFGPGSSGAVLDAVGVPLDQPGVLATVAASRSYYLGPVGPGEANGALLQAVRRPAPASAAVIPVLLRDRVVLLLYGDNGARGVTSEELAALLPVANRMAHAFERLILRRKRDELVAFEGPATPAGRGRDDPPPGGNRSGPPPVSSAPPAGGTPPLPPAAGALSGHSRDPGEHPGTVHADEGEPPEASAPAPESLPPPTVPPEGDGVVILLTEVLSDPVSSAAADPTSPAPTSGPGAGEAAAQSAAPPSAEERATREDEPVEEEDALQGSLPSVIVDMGEDVEALVERALGDGAEAAAAAEELQAAGELCLPSLIRRFPGDVKGDWKVDRPAPSSPTEHGRLLALLARFGDSVAPYVAPLLGSGDPKVRYYAVLVLGALEGADAVETIGPRLLDLDPMVARLAVSLVPRADSGALPDSILEGVRGVLADQHASDLHVQRAAEAAGELRDAAVVPLLVDLLQEGSTDQKVSALRALRIITGQEFGNSARRWAAWWARARHQHRIEWLIDALDHRNERARTMAASELRHLVPLDFGYAPASSRRERDRSRRRYQQWWRESGRAQTRGDG